MSESLNNLNTLATSLPMNQQADQELLNNFKAAAQSITTLYRSSRENSKRSYNQGYVSACKDLMAMIQQGVSSSSSDAMAIGKVLDWLDARVEEVRSREEEEAQEEEESTAARKPKQSSSPSPPPPVTTTKSTTRPSKRSAAHDIPVPIFNVTAPPEPAAVGAKRRHAVMMMLDRESTSPPDSSSSTPTTESRRRTRSTRGNHIASSDPMDTDEDGRERKRVARR